MYLEDSASLSFKMNVCKGEMCGAPGLGTGVHMVECLGILHGAEYHSYDG